MKKRIILIGVIILILISIILLVHIRFKKDMNLIGNNLCNTSSEYKYHSYKNEWDNLEMEINFKCSDSSVLRCDFYKECIETDDFNICIKKNYLFWCYDSEAETIATYISPISEKIISTFYED